MSDRRRSFYTARPTLAEMYGERATLFSALSLPEGVTAATLQGLLLEQFGALDTICETATGLEAYLGLWSAAKVAGWTRIAATLTEVYDPLHNYDRTETEEETLRSHGGVQSAGRSSQGGSTTETTGLQGYNSEDFVPSTQVTSAPAATTDSNSSTQSSASEERGREVRAYGNIGVTTSQQMAEAEIALRQRWTLYGVILDEFRRDICVGVW